MANPSADTECKCFILADTNAFLSSVGIGYRDRWRDFGILWCYVVLNGLIATLLYWCLEYQGTVGTKRLRKAVLVGLGGATSKHPGKAQK